MMAKAKYGFGKAKHEVICRDVSPNLRGDRLFNNGKPFFLEVEGWVDIQKFRNAGFVINGMANGSP